MANFMASVFYSLQTDVSSKAVTIAPYTEEVLMLMFCLIAFAAWQSLGCKQARKRKVMAAKAAQKQEELVTTTIPSIPPQNSELEVKEVKATSTLEVLIAERQMMQHLEQREFTRALNMYRSLERSGACQNYSEELFSSFIQSSIRVGKVDVVEQMLGRMKRNKQKPSLKFWQITLKQLSSRKHFSTCLVVHTMFGWKIPSDNVVFSCLVNAALEVGSPVIAQEVLKRYSEMEVEIEPRDYVLFFRTYVALNDADAAEKIFRYKTKEQTTSLMFNLLLLTCVNAKEPDRAHNLIHEAHALEEKFPKAQRIVNVVSYNTLIKGFAHKSNSNRCVDLFHEIFSKGLEPDNITFSILLDSCIKDGNSIAMHKIVNMLLCSDWPMDTVVGTIMIKGLIREKNLPKALEVYWKMKQRNLDTTSILVRFPAILERVSLSSDEKASLARANP